MHETYIFHVCKSLLTRAILAFSSAVPWKALNSRFRYSIKAVRIRIFSSFFSIGDNLQKRKIK
ncbi:MAG: hypothetical protein AUK31_04615 [Fibrobacteres bacterium CG2_30_45_31]|nr:MAG: hypothetical protein AUK31_04615 [Fibrobacteres bacterium CG2_30_45_31]